MQSIESKWMAMFLLLFVAVTMEMGGAWPQDKVTCPMKGSPCFGKFVRCPKECPHIKPRHPRAKACFMDCRSPKCEAVCRDRYQIAVCHKPNCEGPGSGCHDPRFIGADGAVFYFHGRKDEHFSLVSDPHLQINARFIGLRPAGRTRDFTWIQALGFMYGSHNFTVEAAHVKQWSNDVDHLKFSYDGKPLLVPEGHLSHWKSPDTELTLERTGTRNSIMVVLEGIAEAMLKVVPITKEDDELHNYQIPSDDSYAHLEVQFRFFGLSPQVEGVLGRTYRPDYENTVKRGVLMPVVGGEDKYKTSSLLSADCKLCSFSLKEDNEIELRILR
ncbi:uncharacterized protein LOC103698043 [Phoenix dactylifera]|uniref:Uncharacterized protein LOC103698043 n=1 Tax=Phoenix dactylifera TaxID=42345 RepID=A0A8B8ZGJ2_PHODC|nr:uncharacterized protein LOC103698043 [Phoenix dactylifera]